MTEIDIVSLKIQKVDGKWIVRMLTDNYVISNLEKIAGKDGEKLREEIFEVLESWIAAVKLASHIDTIIIKESPKQDDKGNPEDSQQS